MNLINILNLSLKELQNELIESGEKSYRAKQIFNSIHKRNAASFDEINSIPKELIKKLKNKYFLPVLTLIRETDSKKFNTRKFLFELSSGKGKFLIESVLISENERETLCISTQVGCNVGCEFCATGKMGFKKNLDVSEIIAQIYEVKRKTGITPSNIVYMGMGEPFLNYDNMLKSLLIITHKEGLDLSSRRITVSTVGFKGKIINFADDLVKEENRSIKNVKLAFSLHSTDNGVRESIIPTSVKSNLTEMYNELTYFYKKTRNKITYEYIYFENLNDTENDVKRLSRISKMVPSNINIIPFHPIGFELNKPLDIFNTKKDLNKLLSNKKLFDFIARLKNNKVVVNLRSSSGVDINAACGQLSVSNTG